LTAAVADHADSFAIMDFDENDDLEDELRDLSPLMQALVPKMTACRVREYEPEDFEACVEVHQSNEPDYVAPAERSSFKQFLKGGTSYFLVVEHDGDVIGCGGLELVGDPDSATLMHSMIHREYQRRGFGSALLAAQMALLETEEMPVELWASAPPQTAGFYERLGFQEQPPEPGADQPQFSLQVAPEDIEDARAALLERGVHLLLTEEEDDEEAVDEPVSGDEERQEEEEL
jgi:ribosomal protein S18 acetylase RimI-like enzyme